MDFESAMYEVLKQRKYDKLTGRIFDWRAWLKERVLEILRSILEKINFDFSSLFQPGSNGWVNIWKSVLSIVGIILLLIIFIRLIFYIRKKLKQRSNKSKGIFEGIDKDNSTAAGLLQTSAQLASDGYQRDAVRYCLAAVLLALDKKKIYRLNYSKTNRQILRDLHAKAPFVIPVLTAIVDVFNAVWFGHRVITDIQFEQYWRQASFLAAEVEAYKQK